MWDKMGRASVGRCVQYRYVAFLPYRFEIGHNIGKLRTGERCLLPTRFNDFGEILHPWVVVRNIRSAVLCKRWEVGGEWTMGVR